ncbi:14741_t:CDS:2 [Acaulospora morrowiae]|uniref:14741_t:CDS:1 n=1 Tax=Acaulospora morrowiae TaxID=94023 RepID=A0A9N9B6G8_9GLOM|nr:14741_t:CDS:2 [Acaulospora morrowiae]
MALQDVRVVVAIDFGTTNSAFAFAHKDRPKEIVTFNSWPGNYGNFKNPTVLKYCSRYKEVIDWGKEALVQIPHDESDNDDSKPIEEFKLHLYELDVKPWLPPQLTYNKAIQDYLTKMRELIQDKIQKDLPTIKFPDQIKIVLTIPAEWPPRTTDIMRECAFKAGLLSNLRSKNLEFTTEPEAAALHCLTVVDDHDMKTEVADCGGGTVDITMRKLLPNNELDEITERTGYPCGSTFVDKEFLRFLGEKLSFQAVEKFKNNHYEKMQCLIQEFFCEKVKYRFNGEKNKWRVVKLDLQRECPDLIECVEGRKRSEMEDDGWIIKLDFNAVKDMFDPVINKILELISEQLNSSQEKCSVIFLVGGFCKSDYLYRRVQENFRFQVPKIVIPQPPDIAVVRGGLAYGINDQIIKTRVLKWTFGVEVAHEWIEGKDKRKRRTPEGLVYTFEKLAQRGTKVDVNKKFSKTFYPVRPKQVTIAFKIFTTKDLDGKFCDDPGMKHVGTMKVSIDGTNCPIEFSLTFGRMEFTATAVNEKTKQVYPDATFELEVS